MCIKAIYDSLGPDERVPSAFVWVAYPCFTIDVSQERRSDLPERATVANKAREEMVQHMTKLRLEWALRH